MASDGYLLVRRCSDERWLIGHTESGEPIWLNIKSAAYRFNSQKEFRAWHMTKLGRHWTWSGKMRFVRVRPRKEAA